MADRDSLKNHGHSEVTKADAEADAMLALAQWINCQGDAGEAAELMDEAGERHPDKVERLENE